MYGLMKQQSLIRSDVDSLFIFWQKMSLILFKTRFKQTVLANKG